MALDFLGSFEETAAAAVAVFFIDVTLDCFFCADLAFTFALNVSLGRFDGMLRLMEIEREKGINNLGSK